MKVHVMRCGVVCKEESGREFKKNFISNSGYELSVSFHFTICMMEKRALYSTYTPQSFLLQVCNHS